LEQRTKYDTSFLLLLVGLAAIPSIMLCSGPFS
jgi:hypothetical protein